MTRPGLAPSMMVLAVAGFSAAAATSAVAAWRPRWWEAAVTLAILGGIEPLIQAVSIRVMPVFARRQWRSTRLLAAQAALTFAGAWLCWFGRIAGGAPVIAAGAFAALAGGALMAANVAMLLRQPAGPGALPVPSATQVAADRCGRQFTRLAGACLVYGLAVGAAVPDWEPASGRWDLVWAHSLLVGFFLSMVAGVSYHVLPRWTGVPWERVRPMAVHFRIVAAGLPLMIAALAFDLPRLFAVAGVAEAAGVALFLSIIAPQAPRLPGPTRHAFLLGGVALGVGILLGGAFAVDPATGAALRQTHAVLNVFGFAGAFTAGSAYYLAPRFAGRPLRWPGPALGTVLAIFGGAALAAAGWAWRVRWGGPWWPAAGGALLLAGAFAVEAVILWATFVLPPARPVQPLLLRSGGARQPEATNAPACPDHCPVGTVA